MHACSSLKYFKSNNQTYTSSRFHELQLTYCHAQPDMMDKLETSYMQVIMHHKNIKPTSPYNLWGGWSWVGKEFLIHIFTAFLTAGSSSRRPTYIIIPVRCCIRQRLFYTARGEQILIWHWNHACTEYLEMKKEVKPFQASFKGDLIKLMTLQKSKSSLITGTITVTSSHIKISQVW